MISHASTRIALFDHRKDALEAHELLHAHELVTGIEEITDKNLEMIGKLFLDVIEHCNVAVKVSNKEDRRALTNRRRWHRASFAFGSYFASLGAANCR